MSVWNRSKIPVEMIGATASVAGVKGTVPAPAAGKQNLPLLGSGTFATLSISGGGTGATTAQAARSALGAVAPVVYASAETLTGDTWIDGKPIYRKILSFTNLAAGGVDKVLDATLTASYISTLVKGYGSFNSGGTAIFPIPLDLAETSYIAYHISSSGLNLYFTSYFTSTNSGHVVVEYTKA